MSQKRFILLTLFIYLGCSILIFGSSLGFGFVYDDVVRIERNHAIQSLSHPLRFFRDRTTQASIPDLHRDNYRPLVTLNFAIDYKLWKLRAGFYRAENILFHVLNAVLVTFLAQVLLGLSALGALGGGLLFLIHPVQTESVVWIVGRSNVISVFFSLASLFFWELFQKKKSFLYLLMVYGSLLLGLFSREIVVVLPLVYVFNDWCAKNISAKHSVRSYQPKHYLFFGLMALGFVLLRMKVLGQLKQSSLWGDSVISHIANVVQVWPLTLRVLVWPHHLRATYSDIEIVSTLFDPSAFFGLVSLILFLGGAIFFQKKYPPVAYCMGLFLILWLPGSNVVPLMTLFAERLLYPLMIPFAFGIGLFIDFISRKMNQMSWVANTSFAVVFSMLLFLLSSFTFKQSLVWENEHTLWHHSTQVNPDGWFGWHSLGLANFNMFSAAKLKGDSENSHRWLDKAEESFMMALTKKPPVNSAGETFLCLAIVNLQQGKVDLAKEHARRALVLRPDLETKWLKASNFTLRP